MKILLLQQLSLSLNPLGFLLLQAGEPLDTAIEPVFGSSQLLVAAAEFDVVEIPPVLAFEASSGSPSKGGAGLGANCEDQLRPHNEWHHIQEEQEQVERVHYAPEVPAWAVTQLPLTLPVPALLSPLCPVADDDSVDSVYHYELHSSAHSNMHYNQQEGADEHIAHVQLHSLASQDIDQLVAVHMESEQEAAMQKVAEQALLEVH
ncbi:uncharacterized protein EDB93DRAFT_1106310 [Suillus bovinus]|uniref:uncharacterized protein n=1 Tax=Suillus bovinus TaxID=48563 RepID=UPI001B887167|nr:uncharacterized protein EDB93DRAFT_1106310 [Suillus bovinus]KAG2138584.1 hypothetical protein EDB93DRAFT_1106310 [Suillus bovinus]